MAKIKRNSYPEGTHTIKATNQSCVYPDVLSQGLKALSSHFGLPDAYIYYIVTKAPKISCFLGSEA